MGTHNHFRDVGLMEIGLDAYPYASDQYGASSLHAPLTVTSARPGPGHGVAAMGRHHHHHHHAIPSQHQHIPSQSQPGQFGLLAPSELPGLPDATFLSNKIHHERAAPVNSSLPQSRPLPDTLVGGHDTGERSTGTLNGRIVLDPPDLQAWRQRLFDVDEIIVLTHAQFEVYFPHIDNIYSHRSTQKYKRKPFISHYWDCRMKGRPPGTPKSTDPNKKKRKRNARERDLCDVKIKISEYFPLDTLDDDPVGEDATVEEEVAAAQRRRLPGQRFWTIQRVNGNGGNGKGDGIAGSHRHTLEKSDEIKKNSVQRYIASRKKAEKKVQKAVPSRKTTGSALATVKEHSSPRDIKLYAAYFCPFAQRVWIALEVKGLEYQYCEIDTAKRSESGAAVTMLSPAIQQGDWKCSDSSVILEFLEDLEKGESLSPQQPRDRAKCRTWINHINTQIVLAFFAILASHGSDRRDLVNTLQGHIGALASAADFTGPYFFGSSLSLVDVHIAPFAVRLSRMLQPSGSWPPDSWSSEFAELAADDRAAMVRWQKWVDALEANPHVRATMNMPETYLETAKLLLDGGHRR